MRAKGHLLPFAVMAATAPVAAVRDHAKGLKHCRLTIKKVTRPTPFFTVGPSDIHKSNR